MKNILTILILLISFNTNAQFLKDLYNDFLKYGSFYAAGNIGNAKMEQKNYFVRTNPDNYMIYLRL